MRLGVILLNVGPLAKPEDLTSLDQHAKRLGYEGVSLGVHIIVPGGLKSERCLVQGNAGSAAAGLLVDQESGRFFPERGVQFSVEPLPANGPQQFVLSLGSQPAVEALALHVTLVFSSQVHLRRLNHKVGNLFLRNVKGTPQKGITPAYSHVFEHNSLPARFRLVLKYIQRRVFLAAPSLQVFYQATACKQGPVESRNYLAVHCRGHIPLK